MSDESETSPTPDRLFPDEEPLFLDRDADEDPEAAGVPPAIEEPVAPVGEPAGLPSARDLKPGEFHRPPPDLSSLPSIAAYQPAQMDTGDDEEPTAEMVEPMVEPAEPTVEPTIVEPTAEPGPDDGEPPEPAGLPSARDLKPGEFHRPPPSLSSLPTVAAYQPAALDPIDDDADGLAEEARPDDEEASERESTPEATDRPGFDELPVYPPVPRPGEITPPPPPPPPRPAVPVDTPPPIDPGPAPPPPKIRVGPPPPGPAPATTPAIEPPAETTGGPELPVRDSPPAPPPIRAEIPSRGGAPTAAAPVPPSSGPPPAGPGSTPPPPSAPPPQPPRRPPEPELTMEDLIAASMAQRHHEDEVDWLTMAEAGRTPSRSRRIAMLVGGLALVALVLGIGAIARQADRDAGPAPGNDTALLAVDPDGTPDAPFGIGDWAEIGGGWWVSLAEAEVEAEAILRDAADFNPAPRNGGYAMVSLDVRYTGDRPTTLFDLSLDAVAPSGRSPSACDCRATEPHPLDRRVDVFPGAIVTGDECFDVAVADRYGLLLAVASGPAGEPIHFSFTARGSSEATLADP